MCFKAENFENLQKSLISWYWSGFKANSGLDLVRTGTKKWSVFGPILINLGPIWQVVALGVGSEFFTFFPISIILQLFCNITFIRNVYILNFSQFRSRGGSPVRPGVPNTDQFYNDFGLLFIFFNCFFLGWFIKKSYFSRFDYSW